MVHLFDIMRQAQNGAGFDNLSRQFGLDAGQTQRAVEALLPAFSLGLFRNAQNPSAFANLLGMMGSGQYAPYFEMLSWSPQAAARGETALSQLFGSPEVAQQVSAQASAASGIAAEVIRQMLPVMAATLMGGMSKTASIEGFADFLRQWSDTLRRAHRSAAAPGQGSHMAPFDPFAMWRSVLNPRPRAEAPTGAGPTPESLAAAWSDMMTAMLGGAAPPAPAPKPPVPTVVETMFRMFETGRDVQTKYFDDLRRVFDQAWSAERLP